jgi:hypothetical protein
MSPAPTICLPTVTAGIPPAREYVPRADDVSPYSRGRYTPGAGAGIPPAREYAPRADDIPSARVGLPRAGDMSPHIRGGR